MPFYTYRARDPEKSCNYCREGFETFQKIKDEMNSKTGKAPALSEIGAILLEHHDLLAGLIGQDTAIRQCRKLGSFYSKQIPGAREFRNRLNFCHQRADLEDLIRDFFKP